MSGFTPTGPFVNGGAPGLSASVFNNIENFIQQLEGDINPVILSGGTSGTATAYQVLQGTFKYTFISLAGFRTAGAAQQITLPTPYTTGAYIRTTDTEAMSVKSGGTDQAIRTMNAFPSAAGNAGTSFAGTYQVFNGWNFVVAISGFNQVNFGASWTLARTAFVIIEGE